MTSFLFCNYAHPADIHFQRAERRKRHSWSGKKISFQQHNTVHSKEQKSLVFMYYCIIGKYLQIAYVLENFSAQIIEVPIHKMQIITSIYYYQYKITRAATKKTSIS